MEKDMKLLSKLPTELKLTSTGTTKKNSMGLFYCPSCKTEVTKIRSVGLKAATCGAIGCKESGPRNGHLQSNTPVYVAWSNMKQYCNRSKNEHSIEWNSFDTFRKDMGDSYVGSSRLTRVNSLAPYSKDNCFWVTPEELLHTPTNSSQQSCVTGRLFEQHGYHGSRPYRIWSNMRLRCYDPKHRRYSVYGGKGIRICDAWLNSFTAFWQDMQEGYTDEMTIDRKNSNGDYEKSNCRWMTLAENSSRSRATVTKQIDPVSLVIIKEWPSAREAGLTLGIDTSSIAKVCNGKMKTAGGFLWSN